MSLIALVNKQLPEVVRYLIGVTDFVADHHEPDRRLFGVDRPVQGATVWFFAASSNESATVLTNCSWPGDRRRASTASRFDSLIGRSETTARTLLGGRCLPQWVEPSTDVAAPGFARCGSVTPEGREDPMRVVMASAQARARLESENVNGRVPRTPRAAPA